MADYLGVLIRSAAYMIIFTNLAAHCGILSMCLVCVDQCGVHTRDTYSSFGLIRTLFANSLTSGLHGSRVLLILRLRIWKVFQMEMDTFRNVKFHSPFSDHV